MDAPEIDSNILRNHSEATAAMGALILKNLPDEVRTRTLDAVRKGTGKVELRTRVEPCAHRHRFETLQHASRVIGDWISFYNQRRPHQALGMKTPAQTYQLTL